MPHQYQPISAISVNQPKIRIKQWHVANAIVVSYNGPFLLIINFQLSNCPFLRIVNNFYSKMTAKSNIALILRHLHVHYFIIYNHCEVSAIFVQKINFETFMMYIINFIFSFVNKKYVLYKCNNIFFVQVLWIFLDLKFNILRNK